MVPIAIKIDSPKNGILTLISSIYKFYKFQLFECSNYNF